MKKIIPLFIFLFSCVNTGSSIKDSPSIKNVQKDKCEIISFFSSNQNKKIVKCNSGYSFQMPNEEIDSKSCEIKSFNARQLYYPFREIHKKIGNKKKIISLFIYMDKEKCIHIHKYEWDDFNKMTDIKEIGYYKYIS